MAFIQQARVTELSRLIPWKCQEINDIFVQNVQLLGNNQVA